MSKSVKIVVRDYPKQMKSKTEVKLARNIKIVKAILKGKTAAEMASRYHVSRERIRQIITKGGIHYQHLLSIRRLLKETERKIRLIKYCKWCGKPFLSSARFYCYCSKKCRLERNKKYWRENAKRYYYSENGKTYHKKYVSTHRERLNKYVREWQRKKRKKLALDKEKEKE